MTALILTEGSPQWTIPAGGDINVFGTAGMDSLAFTEGASVTLDASFNAGNDTLYFEGDSTDFTVRNEGATVILTDGSGNEISLAAGTAGQTLVFGDGAVDLQIDETAGTVNFGDQVVTDTDTAVTATVDDTTTSDDQFGGGDPAPAPGFTVSDAGDVDEGGTATFTVSLGQAQAEETTVDYAVTLEGDTSAADHGAITVDGVADSPATGTLTFAAGQTMKVITIPVTADTISPEDGEGITVTLSNPTGADVELGDTVAATSNITDVPVTYTLTQDSEDVQEGEAITYTVTASAPATEDIDVSFSVSPGDASADDQGSNDTNMNDFSQGAFNPTTVTMAAGETSVSYELNTVNDGITELPEAFSVVAEIDGESIGEITSTLLDAGGAGGEDQTFTLTGAAAENSIITPSQNENVAPSDGNPGAGDDTFNSTQDTIASAIIDGSGGTDTLNIRLDGGNAEPAVVENVEKVFTEGRTDHDVVTTGFDGVQEWWSNASRGSQLDIEEIPEIATIGMMGAHGQTGIGSGNNSLFNLSFDEDIVAGNTEVDVVLDSVTSRDSTTEIDRDDNTGTGTFEQNMGDLTIADFDTWNITTQNGSSILDTVASAGVLETLNVSGDQNLTIVSDLEDAVHTVAAGDMTGGLSFDFGDVDASADGVTATTGSGDDSVDLDSVTEAELDDADTVVSVTTGEGDDDISLTSIQAEADRDFEGEITIDGGDGSDSLALSVGSDNTTEFKKFLNLDNVTFSNIETVKLDWTAAAAAMFDASVISTLEAIELTPAGGFADQNFTLENAGTVNAITVKNVLDSNDEVGDITVEDITAEDFTLTLEAQNYDTDLTENEAGANDLDVDVATVNVATTISDFGISADPDFDASVTQEDVDDDNTLVKIQNNLNDIGDGDTENTITVNLSGELGLAINDIYFAAGTEGTAGDTVTLNSSAVGDTDINDVIIDDFNEELVINATGETVDSELTVVSAIAVDFLDSITFTGTQNVVLNGFGLDTADGSDEGLTAIDASDLSGDLTLGTLSDEVGDGWNEDQDTDAVDTFTLTGGGGKLTAQLSPVDDQAGAKQVINTGAGGSEITLGGFVSEDATSTTIDFNGGAGDDKVIITANTVGTAADFGENNTLQIDGGEGTNTLELTYSGTQDTVEISDFANFSSVVISGDMNGEALTIGYNDEMFDTEEDDMEISAFATDSVVYFKAHDDNADVDLSSDGAANIISDALGTITWGAMGDGDDNVLTGDANDNIITGGDGADTLTGGAGADTFVFSAVGSNGTDTIADFDDATSGTDDDVMDFSGLGAVFDAAVFDDVNGAYNSTALSVAADSNGLAANNDIVVDTGTVADLATLDTNAAAESNVNGEMLYLLQVTDYDGQGTAGTVLVHDDDAATDDGGANLTILGVVTLATGAVLGELDANNFA